MLHQHRTEGNAIFNFITCVPFLIIIVLAGLWGISAVGDDAGAVIAFPLFIIFGLFYLWFPSKIFKHWYLEINETGFVYKIFFVKRAFEWDEIVEVSTEKSAEFMGTYNDNLLVKTKSSTIRFFLPDFGCYDKRKTKRFTEQVLEMWTDVKGKRE